MTRKIQIKRGNVANLPALSPGELGLTLDTKKIYVGHEQGNVPLAMEADISGIKNELGSISNLKTSSKGNLVNAVNEVFTSASNGKAAVAAAVTGKGVKTLPTDTYQRMAENIELINTSPINRIQYKTVIPEYKYSMDFTVSPVNLERSIVVITSQLNEKGSAAYYNWVCKLTSATNVNISRSGYSNCKSLTVAVIEFGQVKSFQKGSVVGTNSTDEIISIAEVNPEKSMIFINQRSSIDYAHCGAVFSSPTTIKPIYWGRNSELDYAIVELY